ncbi:hypothetical protein, partial [Flavobacterium sp. B17]|uniref:beta strand repeat-containing protein n=1 Tax=Flavobacterium sp. B17 TaxID=95618 RepID=UPI0005B26D9D
MNKYTIYEPPKKGKALIKMFLARAVSMILLFSVSFIYAQTGPGGVAGASLWLKADDSNSLTTDVNGKVSKWNDVSGNTNNATQATTASQPVYSNSTSGNINFNPVLNFDGTSNFLNLTQSKLPLGTSARTAIGVGRLNNVTGNNMFMGWGAQSTSGAFAFGNSAGAAACWAYGDNINGSALWVKDQPNVITATFAGSGGSVNIYSKGISVGGPISKSWNTAATGGAFLGRGYDNTAAGINYWNGAIGEIIVYPSALNPAQRQKIDSYLAIKYGATLPSDYNLSDGTTVWNKTDNSGYNNNIAGIGWDNDSGLLQKQSQSVNSGFQPIIAKGSLAATNSSNNNGFAVDGDFLVWGSDTGSTTFSTPFAFNGLNYRMPRTWKMQKTGSVGIVKVAIPVSMWPGAVTQPTLLISGDATFDGSDSNFLMKKETIGGIDYYVTDPINLNITSGQYFSFAGFVTAPGGVLSNLNLWLKAGFGVGTTSSSVDTWTNSINTNITYTTSGTKPGFLENGTNFNPSVNFPGNQGTVSTPDITYSDWTVYFTLNGQDNGNSASLLNGSNLGLSYEAWQNTGRLGVFVSSAGTLPNMGDYASTISKPDSKLALLKFQHSSSSNNVIITSISNGTTTTATLNTNNSNRPVSIQSLGALYKGTLSEMILLGNAGLTNLEEAKIYTYMALKYGATLGTDYILADGTTNVWSISGNNTYNNNITGIGRDDTSGLNQKQSQSTNSDIQPVIGNVNITDTNVNNSNDFGADKTFMMWGSDTGSTNFATAFAFGGLNNRMARIWKVQETGTVGKIRVALKVSDLPGSVTKPTLLVSGDTTFDGFDDKFLMTKETIGGVDYYVTDINANIDLSSGQYFSFAAFVTAPGGVLGETLWLKADNGTSTTSNGSAIAQWNDQSTSYNNATGGNNPSFKTLASNFNPAVSLTSGSSQYFAVPQGFEDFTGGTSIYAVAKPKNTPYYGRFIDFGNGAPSDNIVFHRNGSTSSFGVTIINGTSTSSVLLATNGIVNDINSMYEAFIPSGTAGSSVTASILRNGLSLSTGTLRVPNNVPRANNYIGRSAWTGDSYYDGEFSEIIIYQSDKSGVKNRIESYLGIKYGITLGNITTSVNYVASDDTIIWNGSSTYQNNIAGIGRDDASALNQKQSQSVNSDIQPVIGNVDIADTNANNTSSFTADKSFLVWGSDTGSTSFATPFAYGSSNFRMTRIWKIQKTGTIGTVKVAIPVSQLPVSVKMPSLLISADATFDGSDARKAMTQVSLGGVQYYVAEVDTNVDGFTSGHFFSFAGFVTAPGGVAGVSLWLKADAGTNTTANDGTITSWIDQSGNNRNFVNSYGTVSYKTPVGNAGFNFNQSIYFGSATAALYSNTSLFPSLSPSDATLFGISNINGLSLLRVNNSSESNATAKYDYPHFESNNLYARSSSTNGTSISNNTNTSNIGRITVSTMSGGSSLAIGINGGVKNTVAASYTTNTGDMIIGSNTYIGGDDNTVIGNTPEIIAYTSLLVPADQQRVNSYLGIKYGITLDQSINPTGQNYLSSNSSVIWNASADNNAYNNNIAGIGRDDASALLQKQSQSVNTGSQLIVGLSTVVATNAANTGTLNNLQFLMWGDNNAANTTPFTAISGYNIRLSRVWRVQNTNAVNQNIQVLVPFTLVSSSSSLLCGTDAAFSANTYQVYNPNPNTVTINSVVYRVFTVPAVMVNQASFYMTLAFYEQSPGGVRNEAVWLRGDAGLTSTTKWEDQRVTTDPKNLLWNINDCQGRASTGQMVLGKTLNFNPVASFGDAAWTWAFTKVNTSRTSFPNADVAIVYKASSAGTYDVWGTDYGGGFDERSITTTQIANDNTGIAYSGGNSGAATINLASFKGTTASGSNVVINGNNRLNFTGSTTYVGCPEIRLGDVAGAGTPFQGLIGEFVVYQDNISAIDRIQLNSYLALKYGITLGRDNNGNNNSGDPVSGGSIPVFEGDYLASNGTTKTWSSDAVYQNNVVGLGRDDISAFHQRITTSQSATPDIITLSTDSNFVNTNQSGTNGHTDIANDKFFFVTGNNNGALTYTVKSGLSNNLNALMNRVWKVKKTGTAQDVYIKTSNSKATYLVYSADPTFSSGVIGYVPLSGGVTTLGTQIPDGNYFTFATFVEAPGGVYTGLKIWHKADAGVTATSGAVTAWTNQVDERQLINTTAAQRPSLISGTGNTFNFNPYINFNTAANTLYDSGAHPFTYDGSITFFTSAKPNESSTRNWVAFFQINNPGTGNGYGYDNIQWSYGQAFGRGSSEGRVYYNLNIGLQSILTFTHNGPADRMFGYQNLNNILNNAYFPGVLSNGAYLLGSDYQDDAANTGPISEHIAYDRVLSSQELQRVQSYLAVKNGITLPQNHLASDGTTIVWTAGGGYDNNIIGIAKDNTSTLHQRIAKSQMPVSDIIILSTDNNFTNANQSGASGHTDIANDKYYFITGHNGQPTTFTLKSGLNHSLNAIMNRVWKVQQTGTPQNVFVKVDNVRATYLIYSTDPTFSSNVIYKALASGVAAGVQIPTGNYFTFAAPLNGPGGVTTNLVRWYRADRDIVTGATLTWKDQTINADATQSVAVNQPVYNTSGTSLLNFNPSFTFNADTVNSSLSDFMSFSDAGMANGSKIRSVFGVGRTSVTGGTFEWLTSYGTSADAQNFGLMRSGNNVLVTTYGHDFSPYSSASPYASNTPVISYGAANNSNIYGTYNALPIASTTATAPINTVLNIGRIGTRQSGSENWNGVIGEVIYYNTIPSSTDKQRIDSYLGLKYGVTLGNNSSPFTYMSSDTVNNTSFWTGSNTYQNNIAGIGRDDISELYQKQSQSQDQTKSSTLTAPLTSVPQVIIGLGSVAATNEANTGSFDDNLQFLVWGDNNANLEGDVPTPFTAVYPYQERLSRVWRVQNTKNLSKDIQVLIPATYIKNLKVSSLLYSTDATFPTGSQVFNSSSAGMVTINSVNYKAFTIPAAQVNKAEFFFTMAYYQKSPGGVAGENLWLRADDEEIAANADNASVATWKDQSGNNSHGTQSVPGQQPKYKNNATDNMNFNPVMTFNGGQNFDITGTLGINGQKNVAVFAVSDVLGAHYFLQPKVAGGNLLQFSSAGAGYVNLTLGGSSASNTTAAPSGGSAELYSGWRTTAGDVLYSGINAKQLNTVANTTNWTGGNLVMGNSTNGKIPEMVEYSSSLDDTKRLKVNSYLAVKYGITIYQPTTGQDYLASDESKSWTADGTYKYNIAGIGRDDLTALNQKQSQSVNTGDSQMLIALGSAQVSNATNTNTFSSDMQYLVWGDDNGSLTTKVATGNVTANGLTYTKRFSRVWKTQNKGSFASDIKVYFPVSAFANVWSSSVGLIYASTAAKLSDGTASGLPIPEQNHN